LISAVITGDFRGTGTPQTYSPTALDVTDSVGFTSGHLELDLGIPLLIGSDLAPAYLFGAPGFEFDPTDGLFDGIDPVAMFNSASFVDDAGDLVPAVYADLAIAKDGSTILSAPLPVPEPATIALLGVGLLALPTLARRRRACRR
jgi:hypothetical protein